MSHSKSNFNKEIIALFSGQSSILTTPKIYVQLTGSQSLGLVLNQIVFYSNKSTKCKDGWFYKPYQEWYEEILIQERTLRRKISKLRNQELIETKIKKVNGINILHLRPNMDKIIELISTILNTTCPNRPDDPDHLDDKKVIHKNCTKTAPTGHFVRLEPDTLSGSSIYTEEYLHNSSSGGEEVIHTLSSSTQKKPTTTVKKLDSKNQTQKPNPKVNRVGDITSLISTMQKSISVETSEIKPRTKKEIFTTNKDCLEVFYQKFCDTNVTIEQLFDKFVTMNDEENQTIHRFMGFIRIEDVEKAKQAANGMNDEMESRLRRMFPDTRKDLLTLVKLHKEGKFKQHMEDCDNFFKTNYKVEYEYLMNS